MKHLKKIFTFFDGIFGRVENEIFSQADMTMEEKMDLMRWFGGPYDLDYGFVCPTL